jgi:hypothetical protein
MDPEDLMIAEQMMCRSESSQNTVRLPEHNDVALDAHAEVQ